MKFHPLVQEISWVQKFARPTSTRMPMPTGSTLKPICPPSPLVGGHNYKAITLLVPENKVFFTHEQAWQPRWSCYLGCLNNVLFPQHKETLYEIWLQLANWVLRGCLKLSYYDSPGSKVVE